MNIYISVCPLYVLVLVKLLYRDYIHKITFLYKSLPICLYSCVSVYLSIAYT